MVYAFVARAVCFCHLFGDYATLPESLTGLYLVALAILTLIKAAGANTLQT